MCGGYKNWSRIMKIAMTVNVNVNVKDKVYLSLTYV